MAFIWIPFYLPEKVVEKLLVDWAFSVTLSAKSHFWTRVFLRFLNPICHGVYMHLHVHTHRSASSSLHARCQVHTEVKFLIYIFLLTLLIDLGPDWVSLQLMLFPLSHWLSAPCMKLHSLFSKPYLGWHFAGKKKFSLKREPRFLLSKCGKRKEEGRVHGRDGQRENQSWKDPSSIAEPS